MVCAGGEAQFYFLEVVTLLLSKSIEPFCFGRCCQFEASTKVSYKSAPLQPLLQKKKWLESPYKKQRFIRDKKSISEKQTLTLDVSVGWC